MEALDQSSYLMLNSCFSTQTYIKALNKNINYEKIDNAFDTFLKTDNFI